MFFILFFNMSVFLFFLSREVNKGVFRVKFKNLWRCFVNKMESSDCGGDFSFFFF